MPDARLTKAQTKKIFALARERGLDVDAVREMTPAGSVSMLTRGQAAILIDALDHNRSPDYGTPSEFTGTRAPRGRRPSNVISLVTDEQRQKIRALRMELGWSAESLKTWLDTRRFPGEDRRLTDSRTAEDAAFVIELLKHVLHRTQEGKRRRDAATAQ